MNVNVQFYDATQTKVVAVFGCPQDPVAFPNQGTLTDTDPRYQAFINPASTLAGAQEVAYNVIDQQAGQTRTKYITYVAGQSETYLSKAADAANYKAAAYPSASIANYPMVQAEALALYGATPSPAQFHSAADGILSTQAQWIAKAAQIERVRIAGKRAVSAAVNVAGVDASRSAAVDELGLL